MTIEKFGAQTWDENNAEIKSMNHTIHLIRIPFSFFIMNLSNSLRSTNPRYRWDRLFLFPLVSSSSFQNCRCIICCKQIWWNVKSVSFPPVCVCLLLALFSTIYEKSFSIKYGLKSIQWYEIFTSIGRILQKKLSKLRSYVMHFVSLLVCYKKWCSFAFISVFFSHFTL